MGGYCKIVNRSAWSFWPWFAFFVLQIYEFISFVQNNSSKKNRGLKWSFQRTSRNERSSRVENGIFLSLFLFKISIFDDIVICIPTLPLIYCLIFSPLYDIGRYVAKEWKIGRKMQFRDCQPVFLPYIHSKTNLLSPISHLLVQRTRTRAHNAHASYRIFVFYCHKCHSSPKNTYSFSEKQHVVCGKTTRRLWQNNTLFLVKHHVVLGKTSRRLW